MATDRLARPEVAITRIVKCIAIGAFSVLMSLLGLVGCYWLDSSRNRGWEHGYFGEYNRARHALESIAGVVIVGEWYNPDITLEEFEYRLVVNGKPVTLGFSETDSIRSLPRDAAVREFKLWIADELAHAERDPCRER